MVPGHMKAFGHHGSCEICALHASQTQAPTRRIMRTNQASTETRCNLFGVFREMTERRSKRSQAGLNHQMLRHSSTGNVGTHLHALCCWSQQQVQRFA